MRSEIRGLREGWLSFNGFLIDKLRSDEESFFESVGAAWRKSDWTHSLAVTTRRAIRRARAVKLYGIKVTKT